MKHVSLWVRFLVSVLVLWSMTVGGVRASAVARPTWGHARIAEHNRQPTFEVDGHPFFLYGAAFFYERLPRDMWAQSMRRLRSLGINTLDIYVPWNWHEVADGDFDFSGRTSPRRDFDEVLRLARALNFEIVLRPGPVIRNEWRNGGYPAWLLSRPEYGMPLHDLLEGRYPPTATLQNQHADDAALQWMRNTTHVTYAKRWLERVLREAAPYADRILAVALDDDQGAYLDNQTYPAPNFRAYIDWLRDVVHGVTGTDELTFINTYQMKVPASSPVWAMGNWYQSDAFAIGEHDRAQLEFSTGLLNTRPQQPMFASEFQAGWLEQADDIRPRAADPSNTLLASATMLGLGVRGIVNFPAQDTLAPPGWEAPFSNAFYAWDAALRLDNSYDVGSENGAGRAIPTAQLGAVVSAFGPELAAATSEFDAAIAYVGGSVDPTVASDRSYGDIAAATIDAQKACRDANLACTLVDVSAASARELARYPVLLLPYAAGVSDSLAAGVMHKLAAFVDRGGRVVDGKLGASGLSAALAAARRRPVVANVPDGRFLRSDSAALDGFLIVTNYSNAIERIDHGTIESRRGRITLPPFSVGAHDALIVPVGLHMAHFDSSFAPGDRVTMWTCMPRTIEIDRTKLRASRAATSQRDCSVYLQSAGRTRRIATPAAAFVIEHTAAGFAVANARGDIVRHETTVGQRIRSDATLPSPTFAPIAADTVTVYSRDVYRDGTHSDVLDNGIVRVVVSPEAGGRAFSFVDDARGSNCFTTVGSMRDDVAVEPPLSTVDRIAKYTHDFPAGMFNRAYADRRTTGDGFASVDLRYDAPDVVPNAATFSKRVTLEANARSFSLDETVDLHDAPADHPQRGVSVSSLAVGDGRGRATQHIFAPQAVAFSPATTLHVTSGDALGYYDSATHELATIAWRAGDVEDATILERRFSIVARLTFVRATIAHVRYGYEFAATQDDASRLLAEADAAAQRVPPQVTPSPARTQ